MEDKSTETNAISEAVAESFQVTKKPRSQGGNIDHMTSSSLEY